MNPYDIGVKQNLIHFFNPGASRGVRADLRMLKLIVQGHTDADGGRSCFPFQFR